MRFFRPAAKFPIFLFLKFILYCVNLYSRFSTTGNTYLYQLKVLANIKKDTKPMSTSCMNVAPANMVRQEYALPATIAALPSQ